jgi:hypothetical protein
LREAEDFPIPQKENPMNRFLNWLAGTQRTNAVSARRPRSFRPQIERLDERLVPSTLTGNSSAISIQHSYWNFKTQQPVSWTEVDLYGVDDDPYQNQVVEVQNGQQPKLLSGGPTNVRMVSASIDPVTGNGEVFALTLNDQLWVCRSNGTWNLLSNLRITDTSATHDGHVYALLTGSTHVLYFDSNGNFTSLASPNAPGYGFGATSLAASNSNGTNEVFVIGADGGIYLDRGTSPWGWTLVDNSAQFASLSANQNNTVYALTESGHLYVEQYSAVLGSWLGQDISGGRTYQEISADVPASGISEVYAIDSSNHLYLNKETQLGILGSYVGSWTTLDTTDYIADISGASNGYYFDVTFDVNPNPLVTTYFLDYQFNPNGTSQYIGYEIL